MHSEQFRSRNNPHEWRIFPHSLSPAEYGYMTVISLIPYNFTAKIKIPAVTSQIKLSPPLPQFVCCCCCVCALKFAILFIPIPELDVRLPMGGGAMVKVPVPIGFAGGGAILKDE